MANLYYHDALEADDFVVGARLEIAGDEARHALRVARLRVGETIAIGNGEGMLASGPVVHAERDRFSIEISQIEAHPPSHVELVLVQALAKGDRDERAIEQATEFGVDRIIPWQAMRSVSRWSRADDEPNDKRARGVAKWARIVREASKQSMRAYIPEVQAPISLSEMVEISLNADADAEVIVLHPGVTERLSSLSWGPESRQRLRRVYLLVGPEGGLDESEISALGQSGARVLSLGETVLRTSSAGPAALAVLNVKLGRW